MEYRIAVFCTEQSSEFGTTKMAMYVSRELEYGLNRMWHVFIEDGGQNLLELSVP